MGIDLLENPETNQMNPQLGNKIGKDAGDDNKGWLSKVGDFLSGVPSAIGGAATGIGKYASDTFTEERNSVPLSVRLAVAGARKAEDKLKTLRKFYPDAMPSPDGDFTFTDPQTKKRVTLNDAGLSLGDAFESMPEISEAIGATLGAIGGGTLGTAASPGAGTIAGGIAGAGVGGATGNEVGRQTAQKIASLLTGKVSIDTRTGGDYLSDAATTGGLNAAFAGLPLGGRYLKNKLINERLLTPESAGTYNFLSEKGYNPTLGQIGSDSGKELSDRMVAGGMIKKELGNQDVLNQNVARFLGEGVGNLDENALANQFRSSAQGNVQGLKGEASDLYSKVQFGDDIIPADNTRSFIEGLYKSRGLVKNKQGKYITPKGQTLNPDLVLDESMERKMSRIMSGKASEREIESFRSDVKTVLRNRDLKYDTKGALMELDKTLTDDLVRGSPELSQADRAARSAYFDYKNTQKQVKDIIGRSEGVTDNTSIGQGLTEGQSLNNAKKVFSKAAMGSDTEAESLAKVLSGEEKRTILASLLGEDKTARRFENSVEKAQQKYNMERVAKFLLNPDEQASFDDILKQAQGTKAIPEGFRDRSDLLNTEAALTAGAAAVDPSLGLGAAAVGNILRGAPGSAAGSGAFGTSIVRQSAPVKALRNMQSNMALKAAKLGEVPGQLSYMPRSDALIPSTMTGGQMVAGNVGDTPESNLRISDKVINEALPSGSPLRNDLPQVTLDDLLSGNQAAKPTSDLPQLSLDDLLSSQEGKPALKTPVREMQPSIDLPKTNEMGQKLPTREMQPQPAPKIEDLDAYIAKNYGEEEGTSKAPSMEDLDSYIEKTYGGRGNKSGTRDYSYQNKSAEGYKGKRAGKDVFKETLTKNYDLLKNSGITGGRLDHFIAQLAHESGGFNHLVEIDPSKSNLSDKGGDTYKGRGWIQLTGNQNYKKYGDEIGIDLVNNPDMAADPDTALKIAVNYWNDNNLNDLADKNDIRGITRRINGGTNGLNDRIKWLQEVRSDGFEL